MTSDPYLTVERVLTVESRARWLDRAFEMFPRLRGAQMADVLEELCEHDSFLNFTEPWWERAGGALHEELGCRRQLLGAACLVGVVAGGADAGFDFDEMVEALVRAAAGGHEEVRVLIV